MAIDVKTVNSLAYASVKTRNGLAVADIKTWNGVDVTSGGGFVPTDIADCVLWLNADDIVGVDTTPVALWPDASGNGNDDTQANALKQPTLQTNEINGHAAVRFDGSNDYLGFASTLATAECSVFVVEKSTGDGMLIDGNGISSRQFFRVGQDGNNILSRFDGSSNPQSSALSVARGTARLVEFVFAAGSADFYENGTSKGSAANVAFGTVGIGGVESISGLYLNGDIAEIIIYARDLTTGEREDVEDYLMTKYAL